MRSDLHANNTLLMLDRALDLLLGAANCLGKARMPLLDCMGAIIAKDFHAGMNLPPFDKSAMDGYAVRSTDLKVATRTSPITLRVKNSVGAGQVTTERVLSGEATRIMTGAKIPAGADNVVRFEDVVSSGQTVTIFESYRAGTNICRAGEDIQAGTLIIKAGTELNAGEIGILAALGQAEVEVVRRPVIAILATGNELKSIEAALTEGTIRDSNSYTLAALVRKMGADGRIIGIVEDKVEAVKTEILKALAWSDIVITTGGVSVGDYDVVKEAFAQIGAEFLFWRVRMKPGMPVVAAKYQGKILVGLSGNPCAAIMNFDLLVRPLILKLMGKTRLKMRNVNATLRTDFSKTCNYNRFVRAHTYYENGSYHTRLPARATASTLAGLANTNSLFCIPAGQGPFQRGDIIDVQLIEEMEH